MDPKQSLDKEFLRKQELVNEMPQLILHPLSIQDVSVFRMLGHKIIIKVLHTMLPILKNLLRMLLLKEQ